MKNTAVIIIINSGQPLHTYDYINVIVITDHTAPRPPLWRLAKNGNIRKTVVTIKAGSHISHIKPIKTLFGTWK